MKNMLDHLKAEWYKYILEILVIIIGILGAYALNSLNEERKNKKEKEQYLINLLDNLNKDRINLSDQIEFSERLENELDTVIGMLLHPEIHKERAFLSHVAHAKLTPKLTIMCSIYDNLNYSGKLNVLNDSSLTNKLFNYYYKAELSDRSESFAFLMTRTQLIPLLNKLEVDVSQWK